MPDFLDAEQEERYWRRAYAKRPWREKSKTYESYAPALRYGAEAATRAQYRGRDFAEVENKLAREWSQIPERPSWRAIRQAVRDAFDRVTSRTRKQLQVAAAQRIDRPGKKNQRVRTERRRRPAKAAKRPAVAEQRTKNRRG